MWNAVVLGTIGASGLLLGAAISLWLKPKNHLVGLTMGFGVGALISAVAYELVPEAVRSDIPVVLGLILGAVTFCVGDDLISRRGGMSRKAIGEAHPDSQGGAIFLGTLLDGIPESFVVGMGFALGETASVAFVAAVFASNLPEAIAATSSMRDAGHEHHKVWMMWGALVVGCAASAGIGFVVAGMLASAASDFVQAFAAGAILAMLIDSMAPEAFAWGGELVGLVTVLGFIVSTGLSAIALR